MTAWMTGTLAALFWGAVGYISFRWMDSNSQGGRLEQQKAVELAGLDRAREAKDDAAIEAELRRLAKKWTYVDWLHRQYAETLEKQQRYDEAVKLLTGYIRRARHVVDETYRQAPWERFILVRCLHKAGRSAEAEREAQKALRRPHMPAALSILYAEIARDRGDEATAMDRYAEAADHFPKDIWVTEIYAKELLKRGFSDEAEGVLVEGMRRNDRAQALAVLYAKIAQDRSDWPQAVQRWRNVRENYVFFTDAYKNEAIALRALGREDEAQTVLASQPRSIGQTEP